MAISAALPRAIAGRKSEAVVQRCSIKKVFFRISQNSQENTCARVSFLIKAWAYHFINKKTLAQAFSYEFCEILKNKHLFYRTSLDDCFWKSVSFIWCIKAFMNLNGTEWLVEIDWKNFAKHRKSFGTVLKLCQKTTRGRAAFSETLQTAIVFQRYKVGLSPSKKVVFIYFNKIPLK